MTSSFEMAGGEAPFQALFRLAPDAILVVSREGQILAANAEAERIFGFDGPGLVGCSIEALVPRPQRVAHATHRTDYQQRPSLRRMGRRLDLSAVRRDGSEFPVDVSLGPLSYLGEPCVLGAAPMERGISGHLMARRMVLEGASG